jgi:hypothetical protein
LIGFGTEGSLTQLGFVANLVFINILDRHAIRIEAGQSAYIIIGKRACKRRILQRAMLDLQWNVSLFFQKALNPRVALAALLL